MDLEKLTTALAPGVASLVVLLFLMGPGLFYSWFFDKITLYLILFFFFKIIANAFIKRRLDKSEVKPFLIGLVLFIPYVFLTRMTFYEMTISLFQVIVIVSFFWVILKSFKSKLSGGTL